MENLIFADSAQLEYNVVVTTITLILVVGRMIDRFVNGKDS